MASPSDAPGKTLERVHAEIDGCTVCAKFARGFVKPMPLFRGPPSRLVIVGQEPGTTEATSGRAFSGQAGSRLDTWLAACGFDASNPRAQVYLTAAIKCPAPDTTYFTPMLARCRHFLHAQLAAIESALIITLGAVAYRELAVTNEPFEQALCRFIDTRRHMLISPTGFHYRLLPWPHPSGRNRWLNSSANRAKLEATFPGVRAAMERS